MSYKLKTLNLRNFVVFKDQVTIDFSTSSINNIEASYLNNSTQSNGAGKSLIIDGISMALFGKGIRASYMQDYICEADPNGGIYIGLELIEDSGSILKIERWRNPGSDINKAKLFLNGNCVSTDSTISKIDEMVQSYIGINYNNFISCIFSVMIPGFLKLRPSQRFEILEQALAVKKMESVIKKINNALRELEMQATATSATIIEKKGLLAAEQARKEIYTSNAKNLQDSLESHEQSLKVLLEEESTIREKISKLRLFINDEISKKEKPFLEKKSLLSSELMSLKQSKEKLTAKLNTVNSALKKKQKEDSTIECVVCKSSLTDKNKDSIISHYTDEISEVTQSLAKVSSELLKTQEQLDKLDSVKTTAANSGANLDQSLRLILANIVGTEQAIKSIKETLHVAKTNFNDSNLKTLKQEIKELEKASEEIQKSIKINQAWKHALSKNGLRLAYLKEEIDTLSALASKFCTSVYEKPMQVTFFINDDRDNPSLDFNVNGKNAGMFSTGESRRLEIAITLSLMSLLKTAGLNLGFLILDEALDGLSVASKQAILRIIDSLSEEHQILMISHDNLLKSRPGHIIHVEKDSTTGTSKIAISIRQ